MRFWSGDEIKELKDNQIFVFGSNPSGIHGAGAAKAAVEFGAKYGVGRGLQGQTYALITKNLKAGFHEKATGITYETDGYKSVTAEQIKTNVQELYQCAKQHPDKFFIVAYKNETWPNGKPKKSLNGYTSEEMFSIFMNDNNVPENIILHNSFKPLAKAYLENQKTQQEKKMELDDDHYLYKFTAVYMALLDTNNPTQEQLDLLAEQQFIKEPMQLVKPEAFVLKGNTITDRSVFLHQLSKQVTKSLEQNLVAFNSPYQIDKKLGIEFESGLTQKWPMNATVALTKITEDEHHVGYMAISSHENTAAIIKDKATGKAEIHLHTRTRNPDLNLFIPVIENSSNDELSRNGVYVNKSIAEKNAVFEIKTGHKSLSDFFKTKFPKETSEIENFDKVIDRLVNRATIATVSGLKSGEITADQLKLASQLQALTLKIYESDSAVSVYEANAVEDLFTFNSDKHAKNLDTLFNIDTTAIRQLPNETMNKLDIEAFETSFFHTPDKTLFVATPNGITMYKHNDTIEELEGMINDEHTFQLTEMMYVGLTKLTTVFEHQPAHVEPEEPELDPEPEEVKAKPKNKMKI